MDSGFFIPSGSQGHAHLLPGVKVLCWLNEHVRSLTAERTTCRPLSSLAAVHLKTHSCKMLNDTICHRPSGLLTDSRGRSEGAAVRYEIAAGNSSNHNITATSQIPGQTPSGPTQFLSSHFPPFEGISHANTFGTSILWWVWGMQKVIFTQHCTCMNNTDNICHFICSKEL